MQKTRISFSIGESFFGKLLLPLSILILSEAAWGQTQNYHTYNFSPTKLQNARQEHESFSKDMVHPEGQVDLGRVAIRPKIPEKKQIIDSKKADEKKLHRLQRERKQLDNELKQLEMRQRRLRHLAKLKLKRRCA